MPTIDVNADPATQLSLSKLGDNAELRELALSRRKGDFITLKLVEESLPRIRAPTEDEMRLGRETAARLGLP